MRRVLWLATSFIAVVAWGASVDELDPETAGNESLGLVDLLTPESQAGYAEALADRQFHFPADHGPHPEFRHEWWYVTGNLDGPDAERFGFELTLFRLAIAPMDPTAEADVSSWRTRDVYASHFAVTDADREQFHVAQRYARGAAGQAGAQHLPFRVWVEDWGLFSDATSSDRWRLIAREHDIELELELTPLKPPVLNGDKGLSQKSAEPGNATYYYSISRIQTQGVLTISDRSYPVSGLAWLDREWGTSALADDQAGWDWFALQLEDGTDLMFYELRKTDGSRDPYSSGTWIDKRGEAYPLTNADVDIEVLEHWTSPQGVRYPARWRVRIPTRRLELLVDPVISAQELDTSPRYWEGAVDVHGTRAEVSIAGRGYVELTGYAD